MYNVLRGVYENTPSRDESCIHARSNDLERKRRKGGDYSPPFLLNGFKALNELLRENSWNR